MKDTYLEIKNLSKYYPGFTLNNIHLNLPKGYIMGLVGSNGSGKTTTIQLILNILERSSGTITVIGKDNITHEASVKQDLGVVFDNMIFAQRWTAVQVEKALSIFYNNWNSETFKNMLRRFEIPLNKKIRNLSRGMQTKLMLACAFSHEAKLLILDEPTSGLDPLFRDEFLELLQDYIKNGERSVLFSTHICDDIERIADYITFINYGNVFYTGSIEELKGSYRFVKGREKNLLSGMEQKIIGIRKTAVGFEGLMKEEDAKKYPHCMVEIPSINDIVVCAGREEKKKGEK